MYFSRQSRYRNIGIVPGPHQRPPRAPIPILAIAALVLICCACGGIVVVFGVWGLPGGLKLPVPQANRPTPTLDKNAPVPLHIAARGESGLELTVMDFVRPLEVRGLPKMPPRQQFVLVSVRARNPATTGAPTPLRAEDFKIKGDGGLTYDANPKTVTIETIMTPQDAVAPGKSLDRDLIFQVAVDDSGLRLYWKSGSSTRVYQLEPPQ